MFPAQIQQTDTDELLRCKDSSQSLAEGTRVKTKILRQIHP